MKVGRVIPGLLLGLLSSCGSRQMFSTAGAPEKPTQKIGVAVPGFDEEVFDLENARRRIDALGVDDPRLKEHLLNVAIYAAYKVGKTNLIPDVYPLDDPPPHPASSTARR